MAKNATRRIGDDQLVYGMPKRMSAVAAGSSPGDPPYNPKPEKSEKVTIWTVHPRPKACEICKKMEGIKFKEEPERPHPNCNCEIKKHEYKPGKRYISGTLLSYGDTAVRQFFGLGYVDVRVSSRVGALLPGVKVHSNFTGWKQSLVPPGATISFDLNTLTDTQVFWSIKLISDAADNSPLYYEIEYEV